MINKFPSPYISLSSRPFFTRPKSQKLKTPEDRRSVRWTDWKHALADTDRFPDKAIHFAKVHDITPVYPPEHIHGQKRLQHQERVSNRQPGLIPTVNITITSRSLHVQYLRVKTPFPTFTLTHKKTVSHETFCLIIRFFHNDYFYIPQDDLSTKNASRQNCPKTKKGITKA